MKKFKEFRVVFNPNKILFIAICDHARSLGYKQCGWSTCDSGYWDNSCVYGWECGELNTNKGTINGNISVEDFFKLTTEDVVVEPETVLAEFNTLCDKYEDTVDGIKTRITQDQIDRIKTIMGEDNE